MYTKISMALKPFGERKGMERKSKKNKNWKRNNHVNGDNYILFIYFYSLLYKVTWWVCCKKMSSSIASYTYFLHALTSWYSKKIKCEPTFSRLVSIQEDFSDIFVLTVSKLPSTCALQPYYLGSHSVVILLNNIPVNN